MQASNIRDLLIAALFLTMMCSLGCATGVDDLDDVASPVAATGAYASAPPPPPACGATFAPACGGRCENPSAVCGIDPTNGGCTCLMPPHCEKHSFESPNGACPEGTQYEYRRIACPDEAPLVRLYCARPVGDRCCTLYPHTDNATGCELSYFVAACQ